MFAWIRARGRLVPDPAPEAPRPVSPERVSAVRTARHVATTPAAPAGAGTNLGLPGAQPMEWLSRKDWRRALRLYLDGRISRSEFEEMKARLTRVRRNAAEQTRPPSPPRVRVIPGGLEPGSLPRASGLAPARRRPPREAA